MSLYSNCMNAHRLLLSTNAHCLIYNNKQKKNEVKLKIC